MAMFAGVMLQRRAATNQETGQQMMVGPLLVLRLKGER